MENIEYLKKQANVITNLYNSKNYSETIKKGKILIKKFPNQMLFYNATSLALDAEGYPEEGLQILYEAFKKAPRDIFVLNNIGLIKSKISSDNEAEIYFKKALKIKPDFFDALINYGNFFLKRNKITESKVYLEKAILSSSNSLHKEIVYLSLGNLYSQTGEFTKAISFFDKILVINPNNTVADKSISLIHKYKDKNDIHLSQMEAKISNLKNNEDLKRVYFALGKAYEDLDNYEKSFEFIKKANLIQKKLSKYHIETDISLFKKIKKIFSERNLVSLKNFDKKMIFILGMPRSGTTLAEQIISAHREVFGGGELPFLSEIFENHLSNISSKELNNKILDKFKDEFFDKINYFEKDSKIITDKSPLNFRWIGFIQLIFPNAKIIHCERDPMDICWSNYKNFFSSKSLNFSYDLEDLAKYYNLYKDLMIFWNDKFPNKIFNLSYEKLINDQENEIKKIINYCDLDWDQNCLKPQENKKAVATASLSQVRSPIYKSSIKKWENYSKYLEKFTKLVN